MGGLKTHHIMKAFCLAQMKCAATIRVSAMNKILLFIVSGCLLSGCFDQLGQTFPVASEDIPGTYVLEKGNIKQTIILKKDGTVETHRLLIDSSATESEKGQWSAMQTDRTTHVSITNFCLWRYMDICTHLERNIGNPSSKKAYTDWKCDLKNPCRSVSMEFFWFKNEIRIHADADGLFPFKKIVMSKRE
jgi:hypothetical protein